MDLKDELQIGVTVVGMLIGPWIAVKLSLRQFRSQRWWEKQADAYTRLLEALYIMQWNLGETENQLLRLKSNHISLPESSEQTLTTLARIAATGGYVISEAAAKAVETFLSSYSGNVAEDPMKEIDISYDAIKACIVIVKEEAVKNTLHRTKF